MVTHPPYIWQGGSVVRSIRSSIKSVAPILFTTFLVVNATIAQKQEVIRVMDRTAYFLAAAERGETAKVRECLNQGVGINMTDEHGQTSLMLAADQGHVDTVKLLIKHGAIIDLQNKLGGTALMLASFNGHLMVVTELLNAMANVNAKAKNGATALIQAAVKQNEAAVQIINLLLDQKAEINAHDEEGYTALMRAVDRLPPPPPLPPSFRGAKKPKGYDKLQREAEIQLMIVNTLVMKGADLDLMDQSGRTVSEIARMNHQTRILEILKSAVR